MMAWNWEVKERKSRRGWLHSGLGTGGWVVPVKSGCQLRGWLRAEPSGWPAARLLFLLVLLWSL